MLSGPAQCEVEVVH
ncbi:hypothetical protein QTP70_029988, partial [Hemibagrus guttatus]